MTVSVTKLGYLLTEENILIYTVYSKGFVWGNFKTFVFQL